VLFGAMVDHELWRGGSMRRRMRLSDIPIERR
jgi:hypothetical protein